MTQYCPFCGNSRVEKVSVDNLGHDEQVLMWCPECNVSYVIQTGEDVKTWSDNYKDVIEDKGGSDGHQHAESQ